MKRRLIGFSIIFLSILFFLQIPEGKGAIESDECEACHSLYPGMMEEIPTGKLQNILCVNCHSNNDRNTMKFLGGVRVPVVYNTVRTADLLAGGNFHYVAKDFGDRRGHNVDGITSLDTKFQSIPPGYDRESDPSIPGFNTEQPLTCAGSNGCHGNRNVANPFQAIKGSHHAEDSPIDGSTTAKSYRYLKNTDKVKGVLGLEDEDWGQISSVKKHNEYSPSMDDFCANCHGDFHRKDKIGKTSPWFRHPTTITLPKRDEYMYYNPQVSSLPDRPGTRIYSPEAPVARAKIPETASELVEPGTDLVTCLSCHVAHASPHESILRWDYDAIVFGETESVGCLICHTGKGE